MYPFSSHEYRALFLKHFPPAGNVSSDGNFEILPDKRAVLVGMKPVLNGQEITDFGELHDAAVDIARLHANLKQEYDVTTVQYDYIREDSELYALLSKHTTSEPTVGEVSPFINVQSTWEAYLESLERTDRKELKRKFKRLETQPHAFTVLPSPSDDDFATFIRLHKLSDTAKDHFMTPPMETFFKALLSTPIPGWKQRLATLTLNGATVASVLIFENNEQVLLYNSGFDPEQKFYSVGLMLKAWLIRYAIEGGKKRVDFLRGNERYKYDLGAVDCTLYKLIFSL